MKLYNIYGSPNSRKVLAVINALELDIEIIYLDMFNGQHLTPQYHALNPNCKVPTLVDGDFVLWESNAINAYLTNGSRNTTLYPNEPQLRSQVDQWLSWELAHFNNALGTLSLEAIAKPQFMQMQSNEAIIKDSTESLKQYAKILDDYIQDKSFLVNDQITIADYAMIHVDFFKELIPFDWSTYPHLNHYFDRVRADQHWQSTIANPEYIGRIPPE